MSRVIIQVLSLALTWLSVQAQSQFSGYLSGANVVPPNTAPDADGFTYYAPKVDPVGDSYTLKWPTQGPLTIKEVLVSFHK